MRRLFFTFAETPHVQLWSSTHEDAFPTDCRRDVRRVRRHRIGRDSADRHAEFVPVDVHDVQADGRPRCHPAGRELRGRPERARRRDAEDEKVRAGRREAAAPGQVARRADRRDHRVRLWRRYRHHAEGQGSDRREGPEGRPVPAGWQVRRGRADRRRDLGRLHQLGDDRRQLIVHTPGRAFARPTDPGTGFQISSEMRSPPGSSLLYCNYQPVTTT